MEWQLKQFKKQSGAVLVMSLIILSLIMVSVLAVSKLISGEIKVSLNTDNSIVAYYAAETGIEKGLQSIKYARASGDWDLFKNLEKNPAQEIGGSQLTFNILASRVTSTDFTVYNLSTTSPAYLDIMDPSGNLLNIDWGPDNYSYAIDWEIADCFPGHVADRLEVTLSSFASNFTDYETIKRVALCDCGYDTSNVCNRELTSASIGDNKYYRLSFKPLDGYVAKLKFNLYKTGPELFGILSEAKIISQGNYRKSKYPLQVRLPALTPLSNVFSYIIFSEEDIVKNL